MPPRNARRGPVGRTYAYRDLALPSVTTIINRVIAKPALVAWAAERTAAAAFDRRAVWRNMQRDEAIDWLKRSPWRERTAAADQGTLVHLLCELIERGAQPEIPEGVEGYVRAFRQWCDDFEPEFTLTEATTVRPPWPFGGGFGDVEPERPVVGYAGTLDFVCRLPIGELILVDLKTGKDVYPETSLQLTAHRYASLVVHDDGTEIPMPEVDSTWVLRLAPDDYDFVPVRSDAGMRATWEHLLALFEWSNRTDLIGQSTGPKDRRLFA